MVAFNKSGLNAANCINIEGGEAYVDSCNGGRFNFPIFGGGGGGVSKGSSILDK